MKIIAKVFLIFFVLTILSTVVYSQKDMNVKTSAIKSGILIPVGELANSSGIGFGISDLTKWSISKYVKVLGRLEAAVYSGKKIENKILVGYDYQRNIPLYASFDVTTNPIGIITAGSGFEFSFTSKDEGFYTLLDFPSINAIIAKYGELRAGLGMGFGYEFSWGKSLFGLEFRGNIYNLFLTQTDEKTLAGLQIGFTATF